VTFADRIGNAQRGIGPLHRTGMFPGSATPEEWITLVLFRTRRLTPFSALRAHPGVVSEKALASLGRKAGPRLEKGR
jgi:hypothetical protein